MSRLILTLISAVLPGALIGCQAVTSELAARPMRDVLGLSTSKDYSPIESSLLGIDAQIRVPVDDCPCSVHVAVFSPENASKGTILLLHGSVTGPLPMYSQAKKFASSGYCAAVMTFRGFGRSSHGFRTFGQTERFDVVKVIDALEQHGLADQGVGIWGISYGASVTIDAAAIDPRVRAVVAVAPFSSMRTGLPDGLRAQIPVPAMLLDDETLDAIVDRTAEVSGFCADDANQLVSVSRVTAPVLYIHGTADRTVRFEHSELLQRNTAAPSELHALPQTGHVGAFLDFNGEATEKAVLWFQEWLP